MATRIEETGVKLGDFPFPISEGPHESRYLTWIRNHSNYMAVRGLLDYVRAVAVLVRGALVNALVGLPILLVIAVVVAMYNLLPEAPGFYITRWVLLGAITAVVLFPFGASLLRIRTFRRSLGTGTDSSVKLRDHWERRFGALLLLIVAVAAFEALPVFLDRFHFWAYERGFRWPELASAMGVVLAVYSGADKLLSFLGGAAKKIALVAIGALGLLMPLLIVLFVADFLVFTRPSFYWTEVPLVAAFLLTVGIALVLVVGTVTRAFSVKNFLWVFGVLILSFGLIMLADWAGDEYVDSSVQAEDSLDEATRALSTYREFDALIDSAADQPGPRLKEMQQRIDVLRPYIGDERALAAPDAGIDEQLRQLDGIARAAALDNVAILMAAVQRAIGAKPGSEPGETGRLDKAALESEIDGLLSRAVFHPPLFSTWDDSRELLRFVFEDPALEAVLDELRTQDRARERVGEHEFPFFRKPASEVGKAYPLLFAQFKDLVPAADHDLSVWQSGWGELLREVRLEVAASAVFSPTRYPAIYKSTAGVRVQALWPKVVLVLMLAVLVWFFCWLTVDINLTSIHGLYRDRLASAFLIGADTKGDVDIEEDLDLGDLARHEAGSTAPYHLINVALNLQGSRDIGIRDRRSDFFVFSKRFIGGKRTGYCRGEAMERVFPGMSLSTAMAISAAAASPNMGRATSPALVAFMALLNVRLGIWVPNPGVLQDEIDPPEPVPADEESSARGFSFPQVFREEMVEITRRWEQFPGGGMARKLVDGTRPTIENGLVGIGFSGGGIRSASLNLGIAQALHRRGVFDHFDYMSTVSGGGYLGSSISAIMRRRTRTTSEVAGRASIRSEGGQTVLRITPEAPSGMVESLRRLRGRLLRTRRIRPAGPREYRYASYAQLADDVVDGGRVRAGQRLLKMGESSGRGPGTFGDQFRWRVRPTALLREMLGRLDETHRWVNVSDGGHIENLACIELLRRRCKYIVIGDGEADPEHRFNGLATLMRSARIDLGIHIEINLDALRLGDGRLTRDHWAIGRIHYPGETERGYLLYLKSSVTGDEDEVIHEYRQANPAFPHESTADQMFNEGQFEAYRSLGQHIGEQVLEHLGSTRGSGETGKASFADLEQWFRTLSEGAQKAQGGRA